MVVLPHTPGSTSDVQGQKAVTAYFSSKQLLPFSLAEQSCLYCICSVHHSSHPDLLTFSLALKYSQLDIFIIPIYFVSLLQLCNARSSHSIMLDITMQILIVAIIMRILIVAMTMWILIVLWQCEYCVLLWQCEYWLLLWQCEYWLLLWQCEYWLSIWQCEYWLLLWQCEYWLFLWQCEYWLLL